MDQVVGTKPPFTVDRAERDGALVATVTGVVDHGSAEVIDTELATGLDRRPAALVVDLDGVEFFGSLGITVLLRAREHAARLGVGFAVAASRRPVVRTLQVTDLLDVLRVRRTVREALDLARG